MALVAPTMATDGPSSRSAICTVDNGRRTPPPTEDGSASEEGGTRRCDDRGRQQRRGDGARRWVGGGMAHSRRGGRRTAVLGRGWTESMGRPWPGWRRRHHHHCPSPSFLHAASLSPLALTGGGGVAPVCGRIRRRRKPCCQRMGWGENKGGRERRRQCTRCSRPAPPAGAGGEGRERQ